MILDTPTLPALTLAHPPPRTRGNTNLLSFPDLHNHLPVFVSEVHELLVRTLMHKIVCVLVDAEVSSTELMLRFVDRPVSTHSIDLYRKEKYENGCERGIHNFKIDYIHLYQICIFFQYI